MKYRKVFNGDVFEIDVVIRLDVVKKTHSLFLKLQFHRNIKKLQFRFKPDFL